MTLRKAHVKSSLKKILMIGFLSSGLSAFSQGKTIPNIGNWTMFFGQVRFHDKWSIHAEVQNRDFGIISEPEQILLRSGINYHLSKNAIVTAGYGLITNYAFDEETFQSPSVSENRGWQQILLRNNLGRCFFEHRYRLEQRWIESKDNKRYLDRIRYLMRVSVPLNSKIIEKNTIFLSFYDEAFIHLSSTPFDRNRLYGAFAWQIAPNANIQLGYLAQTVNNNTKSYLQTAVNYTLDLRKNE
ncbi:DUF2490 domain-containing protein [Pedobacter sp. P351]|uniref:DUF2490 domain-containing protein n=1 Tax=Pedobacter superstes TaxID=3133441 RepID=UPI0030A75FE5